MASNRIRGNTNQQIIILDSSAIIMLFEHSINLEDEITRLIGKNKIIIPKPIADELLFLSQHGKGKKRTHAKASLKLLDRYEITNADETGDNSVLYLAQKLNGIVVTNDRELKKRVKNAGLKTIYLRGKQNLAMD